MPYLIDSNVLIQAKNFHYGLDFCPAFWDWIIDANHRQVVYSIDAVKKELVEVQDELSGWVGRNPTLFLSPDANVLRSLAVTSRWVTSQNFVSAAVSTFLGVADYHLVSHAHAKQFVVVTHERYSESVKKIKIPNVCRGLGVKCITPFEMLRTEQAQFVMGAMAS
ncbi:hypothetical protein F4560_006419 [Saccharothrix ecbatanensis]|uniref:DUF4411 family protein n=1 Tax=Saccharothrix ecbatanensis TaxID=1105145 RepID=A0A7W9M423_9PSEU|nr:DUF4411 family protein [Saccharothrix ecbatanensis]MBB5806651.1 hypothetical protein [Saccharothrix ecbatanensis]